MPKEKAFIKSFSQFSMGQWIAALISFFTAIVINRSNITQRGLSEKTGLSLGMVNILLKKFSKKGFIKLERLNGKSFRYILTPEGFKEKSKRVIEYMKIYYKRTLLIKQNIERIIQTYGRSRTYVLFGKDKEMKEIIEGLLKEFRVKYITENDIEKIENTAVVLYWNVEDKAKLEGLKSEFLMGAFKTIMKTKNVEKFKNG